MGRPREVPADPPRTVSERPVGRTAVVPIAALSDAVDPIAGVAPGPSPPFVIGRPLATAERFE